MGNMLPRIRKGHNKLTPEVWDRLCRATEIVERWSPLFAELTKKHERRKFRTPEGRLIIAKITGHEGAAFPYRYDWVPITATFNAVTFETTWAVDMDAPDSDQLRQAIHLPEFEPGYGVTVGMHGQPLEAEGGGSATVEPLADESIVVIQARPAKTTDDEATFIYWIDTSNPMPAAC